MQISHSIPRLTADEAAAVIPHGATVGFSAFTPSGAAKAVPRALAQRAKDLHAEGKPFKIRVLTGASTGPQIDKELAEANAIEWRAPYQSSKELRKRINEQETQFVDIDRKSTRLNSSHVAISYAVFCLKKKNINIV